MVHWIWILVAIFGSGSLGCLAMGMLLASRMTELKLWNRHFRDQRDDFKRQRDEVVKINHNLMNMEQ